MNLKTLLLVGLLGLAGYFCYNFIVTNYNQPAIAYKRFASALLDGDSARARPQALNDEAMNPFNFHSDRQRWLNGKKRFVWYTFLDRRYSDDGNTVTLVVRQTVRVDPPGSDSFFGTEVRQDRHFVTLVLDQSAWKIKRFEDSATQMGQSKQVASAR